MTIAFAFGSIGLFSALRAGSGEAMQSLFPVFFVFLFFSSMALPRDLIAADWFRTVATLNPVSYLIEGIRSLLITGFDGASRSASGSRSRSSRSSSRPRAALRTRLVRT